MKLNTFQNSWYKPGNLLKRVLWYFVNVLFIKNYFFHFNGFKINVLRLFGARIGENVIIKPNVNVKYPWNISFGDNVWIGEGVWLDSLGEISIGNNVCISQGTYLLTGNHNYKKISFDLIIGDILIKDGVWIGAKSIVCPGIICNESAVLSVGSVATKDLEPFMIYQGNPAKIIRKRIYENES
jgi:putative colanic acid biosynthesis acetyltransferase WcaF